MGKRMEQVASLVFRDVEAGSPAFASLRAANEVVALALSLETNGDLEVCVTPKVARELAAALEIAAQRAEAK